MTISKEICTTMSQWGSVPRTGLASFLMHLCAALVDRVAFPGSVRRANRVRRKHEKSEIWASFLMHLCAALIDRVAFSGRNFGAVFEHAKATISKEVCTAMSHWGRVPRAGLASFLTHLCAALVHRDAFFGRNFGAVFEHAKTLIREEHYTAMSHPGEGAPRGGQMRVLSKGKGRSVR